MVWSSCWVWMFGEVDIFSADGLFPCLGGSDPEWAFVVVMAESEDERRENDWTKSSPMGILLFLGFLFLHGFLWGGSGGKPKAAALLWSHLS